MQRKVTSLAAAPYPQRRTLWETTLKHSKVNTEYCEITCGRVLHSLRSHVQLLVTRSWNLNTASGRTSVTFSYNLNARHCEAINWYKTFQLEMKVTTFFCCARKWNKNLRSLGHQFAENVSVSPIPVQRGHHLYAILGRSVREQLLLTWDVTHGIQREEIVRSSTFEVGKGSDVQTWNEVLLVPTT
jgi:hypothetical protein